MIHNKIRGTFFSILIVVIFILPLELLPQSTINVIGDSLQVKVADSTDNTKNQTAQTVDSTLVLYFLETTDSLREGKLHAADTTITSIHQYDPLEQHLGMYATLSNIGTAHINRVFSPFLPPGFLTTNKVYSKYLMKPENIRFYKQYIPFTEIGYVMGPKKEQNLWVTFSREIYRGFSFGMQINMYNSPGAYFNNKTDDKSIFLTGQYYTPGKRYGVVASYFHNKLILQENGGLTDDSSFINNTVSDRRLLPVALSDAQNMIKEAGFFVEQYLNLLKPEQKNDTVKRTIDPGHIAYRILYQRNQMIYSDKNPLSDFYSGFAPPHDSAQTFDSAVQVLFRNQVKWSSLGYNEDKLSRFFHLYFGANFDYLEHTLPYDSVKSTQTQVAPFGGININLFGSSYFQGRGTLIMGGYNSGDFELDAHLTQYLGKRDKNIGKLLFRLQLINRMPDWYFQEYNSNRFRWKNDLNKEQYLIFKGAYRYKELEAGIRFYTVSNYTFLNDSVLPEQITTAETVMQVYAQGNITVKKFGFDGKLVYQTTSRPNIIRLPLFTGTLNTYFRTPVFKNAATLQTGIQWKFFTSYYADAYMPELRQFYLQNETEIGNYLIADFYVTLKIKRARIFVKAVNIPGYFMGYNYFSSPHYPARDPGFNFGVFWKFFK